MMNWNAKSLDLAQILRDFIGKIKYSFLKFLRQALLRGRADI
jgi:hypothetical protein